MLSLSALVWTGLNRLERELWKHFFSSVCPPHSCPFSDPHRYWKRSACIFRSRMKRSMHPEVWSSQTPSREAWEWYPLETVRDGFQSYVMHFLNCWHHHKLWTLMTFPVCLLKRLCSFRCHFKLRYFPMPMFSFQFWLPQKTKRWFIFGLAQHDASQHCCDCVSSILSKGGSHTFIRVTYYTKNITSPSAFQLRWHFDMLI